MPDTDHGPLTRNEITLIRELIKTTIDERDKRYEDRFKASETAVSAALSAQKEAVNAAFAASKEAIGKAEIAQTAYNERSNEFRQTLDDQARLLLSRTEATAQFNAITARLDEVKARVNELEKFRSGNEGTDTAKERDSARVLLYIGLAITFFFSFMGLIISGVMLMKKFWVP